MWIPVNAYSIAVAREQGNEVRGAMAAVATKSGAYALASMIMGVQCL
jgi:hypothetical protein